MKKIILVSKLVMVILISYLGLLLLGRYFGEFTPVQVKVSIDNSAYLMDRRYLVGEADNVFIGKVVRNLGYQVINDLPETQYEVRVSKRIKGEILGTAIVNQLGGVKLIYNFVPERTSVVGQRDIEIGKTYLFVTHYSWPRNCYTIITGAGLYEITNKEEKDKLIKAFKNAYRNQLRHNEDIETVEN
ncbi:MAG: hypothetical protein K0S34_1641 [Bacillales bacterium]|jgi:hypothetical protein|nr:hypothetical protein [Bacillales bacterium]